MVFVCVNIDKALNSLKCGDFVLVHDSGNREDEVDMITSGKHLTPEHISRMRRFGGGLICATISYDVASEFGLSYMHEILNHSDHLDSEQKNMIIGTAPYGDHPTFSLYLNHIQTYTGITDNDRCMTISSLSKIIESNISNKKHRFTSEFKIPGHVPLLIASDGLLKSRQGHTEMSVYLMNLAKLPPVAAICEMMDPETYLAMTVSKAQKYADKYGIPFIDGQELLELENIV